MTGPTLYMQALGPWILSGIGTPGGGPIYIAGSMTLGAQTVPRYLKHTRGYACVARNEGFFYRGYACRYMSRVQASVQDQM